MHGRQPHLLDPLNLEEIQLACNILKAEKQLGEDYRFAYVMTHEPTQTDVLTYGAGDSIDRLAFICVLDAKHNETYEAIVNLNQGRVADWKQIYVDKPPYGQAPILLDDYVKCERIVKSNPEWRAAMHKRGLSDAEIDKIQVDPFSAGYFGTPDEKGKRIVRAVSYYRQEEKDNGYARPIEGIVAVVDLGRESVMRVVDDGLNTPIPAAIINYDDASIPNKLSPPKPLDIIQPEGPGFTVNGWEVEWQNWKFRIGFNQREGLVLNTVGYHDDGTLRSIIHRASITDMVVPYADPNITHYWKTAFDHGEYGAGRLANSLELGCDCLGNIHYFDIPTADDFGNSFLMKHAVCMHEEDAGILWKHYDTRTGLFETRRARQLVLSFWATVGNYDYGFYWRFGQDGSLKLEVKLTGIVQTAAIFPGTEYSWGGKLTPELAAPTHQHLFAARLHMAVDGERNAVSEHEFHSLPVSAENPFGTAFGDSVIQLTHEAEAARLANAGTQRTWNIYNPNFHNAIGKPTAYKLEVPQGPLLLSDPSSFIYQRAGFATKSVWVTRYEPGEKYASGDYPNQHAGGDGLPRYVMQDRHIQNEPVVIWAVFGPTHKPRPEDFPVMPSAVTGIGLIPCGFFNRNPAINLPPDKNKKSVKQADEQPLDCCSESKRMPRYN